MDSSAVVITAYYVQNLIELIGPQETAKILDKLGEEKLFVIVDKNLDELALKVAKDGKKVSSLSKIIKGIDNVIDKAQDVQLPKLAFEKTKNVVKKVKPKAVGTVVGIVGKKVPLVSVGVGAGLALWRILENPRSEEAWLKAGAELASGTASCFPGIGTAVSMTIDGILVAADKGTSKKKLSENENDKEEQDVVNEEEEEQKNKIVTKLKKQKVSVPSLYTFAYQGKDICRITKLSHTFRVPFNFEIWFFCLDNSTLSDYVQVDVLFYSLLAREASTQKVNYVDYVTPSNCVEKFSSGEICDDYKIVLLDDTKKRQWTTTTTKRTLNDEFYMGLVKWTPKFQKAFGNATPIIEEGGEYFLLSQLICDIGRKENITQKCILMFLCDRADSVDDDQTSSELIRTWRQRVKELVPDTPSSHHYTKRSKSAHPVLRNVVTRM